MEVLFVHIYVIFLHWSMHDSLALGISELVGTLKITLFWDGRCHLGPILVHCWQHEMAT